MSYYLSCFKVSSDAGASSVSRLERQQACHTWLYLMHTCEKQT